MTRFDLVHSGKPCCEPRTGWFSRLASIGAALCLLCGTSSGGCSNDRRRGKSNHSAVVSAVLICRYRETWGKIARRGPDPRLSVVLWLPAERMLGPRHLDQGRWRFSHRQFRI